jgi:hypothetical protein
VSLAAQLSTAETCFETTEKIAKYFVDRQKEDIQKTALDDQLGQLASAVVKLAIFNSYPNVFSADVVQQVGIPVARQQIAHVLDALHMSPVYKDVDYSERKSGEMSAQVSSLASAIVAATNDKNAGRTFLFEYWLLRTFWDVGLTNAPDVALVNLTPKINGNRPQGVEPFEPKKYTKSEFCTYYIRHVLLSVLDPDRERQKDINCEKG